MEIREIRRRRGKERTKIKRIVKEAKTRKTM